MLGGPLLATVSLTSPVFADGGIGGRNDDSVGAAGADSVTGPGGQGGTGRTVNGGGGGGAGVSGGAGGDSAGDSGSGGAAPGASGGNGGSTTAKRSGGGGGGGGAHGIVITGGSIDKSVSGGNGGNGGNSATTRGGGGGAGGYGAVITGKTTVNAPVSGGKGGNGGNALAFGGGGGSGGHGVVLQPGASLIVNRAISGGDGGNKGIADQRNGASGEGGVGIVGENVSITLNKGGSVAGGLAGDNGARADALRLTGDRNVLQISGGSLLGDIAIAEGGVLDFAASNGKVANTIKGGGGIRKSGAGTLTLSGKNTYTGPTTVDAGTLLVDGSIASSSLTTINSGGTLGGSGTVGDTLINGGTLAPGNPMGTLTVNGNLTLTANSTYEINVNATTSDRVVVTGTADLGGASVHTIFANDSYIEKQYTIVEAGTLKGKFGNLTTTNLPQNFSSSLSYDETRAFLDLVLDYTQPAPQPTTPAPTTPTEPTPTTPAPPQPTNPAPTAPTQPTPSQPQGKEGMTSQPMPPAPPEPMPTQPSNPPPQPTNPAPTAPTQPTPSQPQGKEGMTPQPTTPAPQPQPTAPAPQPEPAPTQPVTPAPVPTPPPPQPAPTPAPPGTSTPAPTTTPAAPAPTPPAPPPPAAPPAPAPRTQLNANQASVAATLVDHFNANGRILRAFGTLSPAGLSAVSGEATTRAQQTTFAAMDLFLFELMAPSTNGRSENTEHGPALAYASLHSPAAIAAINRAAPRVLQRSRPLQVWASAYGGVQRTDGNASLGSAATVARAYGGIVGADYRISPWTLAGFAMSGGGTGFVVNGSGTGRSDVFQLGAFLRHTVGPAYITAGIAYGWQDVTTNRSVGPDHLRGRFHSHTVSGRAETGYRFAIPAASVGLTPYVAGRFTTIALPDFAEQVLAGPGLFGLNYASRTMTTSRSEAGLHADTSVRIDDAVVTLRGSVAWLHNFGSDRSLTAGFQALPGTQFTVIGAAPAPDAAQLSASANIRCRNNWSVGVGLESELSPTTRSIAGKGIVRYRW